MHLVHDKKKAGYLVFLVFGSYFISIALFLNLIILLGAALFGFVFKEERFMVGVVFLCLIVLLLLDSRLGLSFSLIYPFAFSGVTVLILQISKDIKKGDLIFYTTFAVAVLFVGYMALMEWKFGLLEKTVSLAKEEVLSMGNTLSGVMSEGEIKEYVSFSNKLIDNYFVFILLIQYVLFCFVNFYLIPWLFNDLPHTLREEFSQLKLPFAGIWGINMGLVLYFLMEGKPALWGLNIALFFLSFYFFQGISLSTLFFKKFSIPFYVAILFYVFFLANQVMWLLISVAGVVDVQFNLKKYLKEA